MLCVFREALLRSLQVATLLVFSHRQAIEQCTEQILAFLYLSIRNKQDQSVFSITNIMASQSSESYPHFGTLATHAGQEPEQWKSLAVVPPISLSTTFKQLTPGQPVQYEYARSGNPTREVFEKCVAALEGGKYGIASASGLAATTMLCQLLKSGDHIVAMDDLYGGTYRYFNQVLSNYGIETTFINTTDTALLEKTIKDNTKMIWVESLTNPMLRHTDLEAVIKIARKRKDILVIVDNTFLTPYFMRPLEFGADIVYHSVTKYLNGHSDVVMGVTCTNSEELSKKLRYLQNASGGIPSPFDCYLANRGLKTLHIRMREHQKSAMAVAKFLESSPYVKRVIYPGFPTHPEHEILKRQCKGFGGMVTFIINGTMENAIKFFQAIKIVTLAESLGGYESLVDHPATMTHASIPKEERDKIGIADTLIRMSVGLEDTPDIIEDLEQALKASQ